MISATDGASLNLYSGGSPMAMLLDMSVKSSGNYYFAVNALDMGATQSDIDMYYGGNPWFSFSPVSHYVVNATSETTGVLKLGVMGGYGQENFIEVEYQQYNGTSVYLNMAEYTYTPDTPCWVMATVATTAQGIYVQ